MNRSTRILITILFVVSGLTSLVYETLWIRVLSLGIGSTSASMSMVLSIFFFGLSAGSYYSGKLSRRFKNPLRIYGLIEGFIGIYCLILIHVLMQFPSLMSYMPVDSSLSWLAFLIKFLLVFIFLIAPTFGMGATLPLLVRILSQKDFGVGKNVSWLYTINTLGAVLGAFITGYVLIPKIGVLGANNLMVVLNVLILIACYLVPVSIKPETDNMTAETGGKIPVKEKTDFQSAVVLAVCGMVGFSSIGAEVIWNKYLGVFFGTNIFGLSLILTIFLFGIALGSFVLSRFIDNVRSRSRLLTILLTLTVLSMVGASKLLNISPIFANIAGYYFPEISFLVIKSVLSFCILVIPTCLFGSLLPLMINILTTSNEQAPRMTGLAYAVNTVGGILGSASAGLWLIPQFGSELTLKALCTILVVAFFLATWFSASLKKALTLAITAILAGVVMFGPSIQFKNIIKAATYTWPDPHLPFHEVMSYFGKEYEQIRFLHEGKTAIISLNHEMSDGRPLENHFRLKTNGLNESYYDLENLRIPPKFESLLGLLPYVFLRDVKNAFVVGYGGGYTVDILTSFDIDKVHVVELEKGILKAADYIYKSGNPILERKNLHLEIEDARFILNAGKSGPFDIIVSQPSHSWLSGVANLFTLEFFETVKSNLSQGGIYSQWLNLYNMDEKSLKSILHTFFTVFPEGALFTDRIEGELILLGSELPLELNSDRLFKLNEDETWRDIFSAVPFESPYDLISTYTMGRKTVVEMTAGSPLNTDINAYAEIRQSSVFYSSNSQQETVQPLLSSFFDADYSVISSLFETNKTGILEELMTSMSRSQKYEKSFKLLKTYESLNDSKPDKYEILSHLCYDVERLACAEKYAEKSFNIRPSSKQLNFLLSIKSELKDYSSIVDLYKSNKKLTDKTSDCSYANALIRDDQIKKASTIITKIQNDYDSYLISCDNEILRILGEFYFREKNFEKALIYLDGFYDLFPDDLEILSLLIRAYQENGQWKSAQSYFQLFEDNLYWEIDRIKNLADHFKDNGWEEDARIMDRRAFTLEK